MGCSLWRSLLLLAVARLLWRWAREQPLLLHL
jgi:hypothetical protein